MPDLEQLDDAIRGNKYFNINTVLRCHTLDIVFQRFYDLYYIFAGANFDLVDAANEKLNIDNYETTSQEILRNFLRCNRIKSVILAYNSVDDYIKKIIKFLSYGESIEFEGEEEFVKENKREMQYNHVVEYAKKVDGMLQINSLEKIYKEYNCKKNKEIKQIRKLANDIKHNGDIRFKELPKPSCAVYIELREDEKEKYNSKWVEMPQEELEDIVKLCYRANPIIKKYVEDVYRVVCEIYSEHNLEKLKS